MSDTTPLSSNPLRTFSFDGEGIYEMPEGCGTYVLTMDYERLQQNLRDVDDAHLATIDSLRGQVRSWEEANALLAKSRDRWKEAAEHTAHEPGAVDRAHLYASNLLESLVEKYGKPHGWQPLPDLLGKLTQIDNVIAGLLQRAATPPPALPMDEREDPCHPAFIAPLAQPPVAIPVTSPFGTHGELVPAGETSCSRCIEERQSGSNHCRYCGREWLSEGESRG